MLAQISLLQNQVVAQQQVIADDPLGVAVVGQLQRQRDRAEAHSKDLGVQSHHQLYRANAAHQQQLQVIALTQQCPQLHCSRLRSWWCSGGSEWVGQPPLRGD